MTHSSEMTTDELEMEVFKEELWLATHEFDVDQKRFIKSQIKARKKQIEDARK